MNIYTILWQQGFPGDAVVKNSPAKAGHARDACLIPGWGRSTGRGIRNPLQYSCLENSMDRGDWWAAILGLQRVRHN